MIRELLRQIESDEFAVQVNIASTMSAFRDGVERHAVFTTLVSELLRIRSLGQVVLGRIDKLCKADFDPRYENPHDAALATYLFALEVSGVTELLTAARQIVSSTNLWWAKSAAIRMLAERAQASTAQQFSVFPDHTRAVFLAVIKKVVAEIGGDANPETQQTSRWEPVGARVYKNVRAYIRSQKASDTAAMTDIAVNLNIPRTDTRQASQVWQPTGLAM